QILITKPNHFGQDRLVVSFGLDPANFTDSRHRSFRFNDQSGQLHHAPAAFEAARSSHALEQMVQGDRWFSFEQINHDRSDCCSRFSLTSRRASMVPKFVFATQPPRLISGAE